METLAEYSVEEILPLIPREKHPFIVVGTSYKVGLCSTRLQCFKRSLECVGCGVVGSLFRLQRSPASKVPRAPGDHKRWRLAGRRPGVGACYVEKCTICVKYIQRYPNRETPHFNLYAPGLPGWHNKPWVLMTQDHIVPKSRGGATMMSNLQTMCEKCNSEKGNDVP